MKTLEEIKKELTSLSISDLWALQCSMQNLRENILDYGENTPESERINSTEEYLEDYNNAGLALTYASFEIQLRVRNIFDIEFHDPTNLVL